MKNHYPIYSDTHFNFTLPWTAPNFIHRLLDNHPSGLILTGDIACGLTIIRILELLAKKLQPLPIYFVLGNHDFYATSFANITRAVNILSQKYSNLHWMNVREHMELGEGVGIIGEDGWYDGRLGNPDYLVYNFDWIMINEFRGFKSFEEKHQYSQALADASTATLQSKLEVALERYQTVYILTHMPPWAETTRAVGTEMEAFWLPYNVNSQMGKMIEAVMQGRNDKKVVVLAGHTHVPVVVHVSHNIECIVQGGKYLGAPTEHNSLFI